MTSSSKPREIRWRKLHSRQVTLDGRRSQLLSGKGVRNVLGQLPHVEHTVAAVLEKTGQTTTHADVYPCTKMPLIIAFRQSRNSDSHESKSNTDVSRDMPTCPQYRACQGTSGRTQHRSRKTEERFQREIPSTATMNIPRTCFASKCHPEDSSSTPRNRTSAPDRGSFPPRDHRTHCTAVLLSPSSKSHPPVADESSSQEEARI